MLRRSPFERLVVVVIEDNEVFTSCESWRDGYLVVVVEGIARTAAQEAATSPTVPLWVML